MDPLDVDRPDPWTIFRDAQARMAVDEFDAMPSIEAAHAAFRDAGLAIGCELAARTAVIAIHHADATYVGLDCWVARACWDEPVPASLDAADRAWWLAGGLARTYAEDTTEYGSAATLATRNALLQLVTTPAALDADALLIATLALLEYAEFEDDGVLFDRVVAEVWSVLESTAGSPLYRGRAWQRVQRCAFAHGAGRRPGAHRVDAAMAESRALALAERHGLQPLRASLLVARAFYANVTFDEPTAQAALLELGRITDFRRPLAAAWYYCLSGQTAARQEDGGEALRQFGLSVEAAATGSAPLGVQQNFINGYALALMHAGRFDEAIERFDRLAAELSGRDREITECRRDVADYHRVAAQAPEHAGPARARVVERIRALRWISFALLTPRSTARFLADALRDGGPPEFIAQIVRQRRLRAEPGYPPTWPWPLRIFTLGTFRIEVDGAPLVEGPRPQRKPLELLTVLLALGPQPAATSTVLDALWPDTDGDRAKHSLEMAVLRLRRMLGRDDALFVTTGYLSIDRSAAWVDAWDFAEGDSLDYAGAFLDGEDGQHAVLGRRERLCALFVQRTVARGGEHEAAGRPAEALALYDAALAHDDLVESLHRGAMRCHLALGEPAAALRAYRRCRERLLATLGVEPSRATRELMPDNG